MYFTIRREKKIPDPAHLCLICHNIIPSKDFEIITLDKLQAEKIVGHPLPHG